MSVLGSFKFPPYLLNSSRTKANQLKKIVLGCVAFDAITESETCDQIARELAQGNGGMVVTANLDHLLRCERSAEYLQLVERAQLVVADGMPLIWASRIQRTPLPERVAGSTLSWRLAERLAKDGRSLYLLGGDPGVAEKAAEVLKSRFPELRIAGHDCPPVGFEKSQDEMDRIRSSLRNCQPMSFMSHWDHQSKRS